MPDNQIGAHNPDPNVPSQGTPGNPPPVPPPPALAQVPPAPGPVGTHTLDSFPVVALILIHFFTCGLFSFIWLGLMHGRLPKVREDDPSAGKAVGFCFIPFFNLYWIFFSYRRLCLRVDEQRILYGLPPSNLTSMATAACIFQVIPYVNILGSITTLPIFAGQMQYSVNQLVKTSATTAPKGALQALPATSKGMPVWAIIMLVCGVSIFPIAFFAGMLLPALANAKAKAERINCVSNLKQIGLAFKVWGGDHGDLYPFNVSTNKGGTLEVCDRGADGFDRNSCLDFQVLSNELAITKILVCPGDHSKAAALDFSQLQPMNVSYLVHSRTNVSETYPNTVLAICPIHRNVLFSDGSVGQVSQAEMQLIMDSVAQDR
ncbi:MAG TPA: hypothetical protein VG754_12945 [Verrucomicrobiae bacterium]|nr:hypothetical protein [Verrucomicrobiae bacterium]